MASASATAAATCSNEGAGCLVRDLRARARWCEVKAAFVFVRLLWSFSCLLLRLFLPCTSLCLRRVRLFLRTCVLVSLCSVSVPLFPNQDCSAMCACLVFFCVGSMYFVGCLSRVLLCTCVWGLDVLSPFVRATSVRA